jgi:hypothetical protein
VKTTLRRVCAAGVFLLFIAAGCEQPKGTTLSPGTPQMQQQQAQMMDKMKTTGKGRMQPGMAPMQPQMQPAVQPR